MSVFIFYVVLSLVLIILLGIYIGSYIMHTKFKKANQCGRTIDEAVKKYEPAVSAIVLLAAGTILITGVTVLGGNQELRKYYIDKWRADEIIEQTTYTYHTIGGVDIKMGEKKIYITNDNIFPKEGE